MSETLYLFSLWMSIALGFTLGFIASAWVQVD